MLVDRLPDGTVRTDADIQRRAGHDSWRWRWPGAFWGDRACRSPPRWSSGQHRGGGHRPGLDVADIHGRDTRARLRRVRRRPRPFGRPGPVRMNQVDRLDLASPVADVQAGVRGDQLDGPGRHGLTAASPAVDHHLHGGRSRCRVFGRQASRIGAIEDVLLGWPRCPPAGPALQAGARSAAGPDSAVPGRVRGDARRGSQATLGVPGPAAAGTGLAFAFGEFRVLADGARGKPVAGQTGARVVRGVRRPTPAELGARPSRRCVEMLAFRPRSRIAAEEAGGHRDAGTRRRRASFVRYGSTGGIDRNNAVSTYAGSWGRPRVRRRGDRGHLRGRRAVVRVPRADDSFREDPGRAAQAVGLSPAICTRPARRCLHVPGSGADDRDARPVPCGLGSGCAKLSAIERTVAHRSRHRPPEARYLAEELGRPAWTS